MRNFPRDYWNDPEASEQLAEDELGEDYRDELVDDDLIWWDADGIAHIDEGR